MDKVELLSLCKYKKGRKKKELCFHYLLWFFWQISLVYNDFLSLSDGLNEISWAANLFGLIG